MREGCDSADLANIAGLEKLIVPVSDVGFGSKKPSDYEKYKSKNAADRSNGNLQTLSQAYR